MFALDATRISEARAPTVEGPSSPRDVHGVEARPTPHVQVALTEPEAPSPAKQALRELSKADVAATVKNARHLLERAQDPKSGQLAQRRAMIQSAMKQLRTATRAQLEAALSEPAEHQASQAERSLELNGLELLGRLGSGKQKVGEPVLPALAELLANNPHSPVEIFGLLACSPAPSDTMARLARMYPPASGAEVTARRAELARDLAVGGLERRLTQLLRERGVRPDDIDALLGVAADVREGFRIGAAEGDDMQRTNWIHTRIELVHTLEVAKELGLDADRTLMAALGSLTSDAFKDASVHSLLTHNRAGAELVLPLLMGRHFEMTPRDQVILAGAMRVAHEHQITPPLFMSGALKSHLGGAPAHLVDEIFTSANAPLAAPAKDGEVYFSDDAAALLLERGIPGWAVPMPEAAHHGATIAAIAGDVWQYASPDGILKIAVDIRDPEQKAPFMRDALLQDAIASSLDFSFRQGLSVVTDPAVVRRMLEEQAKTKALLEDAGGIYPRVEGELRRARGVEEGAATPEVPYWNVKVPIDRALTAEERASVDLVKATFRRITAEVGAVPLDPFGGAGAGAREVK